MMTWCTVAPASFEAKYSETAWYGSGSPKDATTTCVVVPCGGNGGDDGGGCGNKGTFVPVSVALAAEEPAPVPVILICRRLWFVDVASFRCVNFMLPLGSGVSLVAAAAAAAVVVVAAAAAATVNALRDETTVCKIETKVKKVQNAQRRMPAALGIFFL